MRWQLYLNEKWLLSLIYLRREAVCSLSDAQRAEEKIPTRNMEADEACDAKDAREGRSRGMRRGNFIVLGLICADIGW